MSRARALFFSALLLLVAACGDRTEPTSTAVQARSRDTVAVVAGEAISLDDVRAEMEPGGPTLTSEQALKRLIERRSLAALAEMQGLHEKPAVRRQLENVLVAALRESRSRPGDELSEERLREFYEVEKDRFHRPERRRLAIIVVDEPSSRDRIAALSADNLPANGFGELAYRLSTHAGSRFRGGDLGWLETGQERPGVPLPLLEAGYALNEEQPLSDVIELPGAWGRVRLLERKPARTPPFEELRPQLEAMLRQRDAEKQEEALMQSALEEAGATVINRELLSAIEAERPPKPF